LGALSLSRLPAGAAAESHAERRRLMFSVGVAVNVAFLALAILCGIVGRRRAKRQQS
jgi:hypothetical protein